MRTEHDTMGAVQIPKNAYYGAQTQRAVDNFAISGRCLPLELVHALGLVKGAACQVNAELGLFRTCHQPLTEQEVDAIQCACREVAEGRWDEEFPVDVYQTGSGTSSNMNINEVIANRAVELCGGDRFATDKRIHPNDHVNLGQSTNDTFPTAIHVAVAKGIAETLVPALKQCSALLRKKAKQWEKVLKIGRTHLADATPLTLGQEIGGMARQFDLAASRAEEALRQVLELPMGGTAVGTGINTHPQFGCRVAQVLAKETGLGFVEAVDHFEANAQRDGLTAAHALLKSVAVTLFNVANNIRFLSSGPRCGYFEIILPDLQPGSSIMPGKVNPVLCESLMQVAARVIGNDQTISFCGAAGGNFQLNVMMPVMADAALESIRLMASGATLFAKRCLSGMDANEEQCLVAVHRSLAMVTALNPLIGYERAAALAKEAFRTGKTIREICIEQNVLSPEKLEEILDPFAMICPRVDVD